MWTHLKQQVSPTFILAQFCIKSVYAGVFKNGFQQRSFERERERGEPHKVLSLLQKEYLSAVAIKDQMARSFLNAKLLSALADGVSVAINR